MANKLNYLDIDRLINDLELEATGQKGKGNTKWIKSKEKEQSILQQSLYTKRIEELAISAIEIKQAKEKKRMKDLRIEAAKRKKADKKIHRLIENYLKG